MRASVIALVLSTVVARAGAYPFLAPRPVANSISGPTDAQVSAIYYNPAALGALTVAGPNASHYHLLADVGTRAFVGNVERHAGAESPGGSAGIGWADFDGFVGFATDFKLDVLHFGVAVYTPFSDFSSFGDSAARYHLRDQTWGYLGESAAASLRLFGRLWIGASFNIVEGWMRYRFDRDSALAGGSALVDQPSQLCGGMACGFENPAARQTLSLSGFAWGIGFSLGVLVRPVDRLWLALSYISRTSGQNRGPDFAFYDDNGAVVTPAPGQTARCAGQNGACSGNSQSSMALPDIIYAGVRVEVTPRFELEGGFRWTHYSMRRQLDVTTQSGQLATLADGVGTGLPPSFLLDRGLTDAYAVWLSGRWRLKNGMRLMPVLFYESSAVETQLVNPAGIDAHKLHFALVTEWAPRPTLTFGFHLGATAYLLTDAGQGFSPRAEVDCVNSSYNLDVCGKTVSGQGLPSADARYTLFVLHLGASVAFDL